MKKIVVTMTPAEAKAVRQGLMSALDFVDTYYMFAPGLHGVNYGNLRLDEKRRDMAYKILDKIAKQLD